MTIPQESWTLALADFLRSQSQIQALMLDPKAQRMSVATLGKPDMRYLERQLLETLANVEQYASQSVHSIGVLVRTVEGKVFLEKPSCPTAPRFWTWRQLPWPQPQAQAQPHEWVLMAWLAGLCGLFGLLGVSTALFPQLPTWVRPAAYFLAMALGGWDAFMDVLQKLPKGQFDIHFLMLAVAIGASAIGAIGEGALLLFLFSFSGALEHFALFRTHKEIKSLFKMTPKEVLLLDPLGPLGVEKRVPVESIQVGDVLVVKPGDLFALDAEVIWGSTAADEATLTGEAHPIAKQVGDTVFAGTINLWGSVQVRVLRPMAESALQKIIRLIQQAQHLKAPSQRFTDRFGTHYTLLILGLTTLLFVFWWQVMGVLPFANGPLGYSAFYRAMTFLVVASPCALVLSVPSAILAAIAWGATRGILFRGGAAIEKLSEIDVAALDKTGTLTTGELEVERVESFPEGQEAQVLQIAYAIEQHAQHPLARAIVAHGKKIGLTAEKVQNVKSMTGLGIQADYAGARCLLGRRELLDMGPLQPWATQIPEPPAAYCEVWVLQGQLLGRILLKDQIRDQSRPVLETLRRMGIRTLMLTGDHRQSAEAVGRQLGISEIRAHLKPEDKVAVIQDLTRAGYRVAMVGDGVNDAPSLAASYVAVGMGARGSDAALEQSDVVLMHDRIDHFLDALNLSRRATRIIHQNISISLITLVFMGLASLSGKIPISLGVVAHEGSTALVCLNSLRLLRKGKGKERERKGKERERKRPRGTRAP